MSILGRTNRALTDGRQADGSGNSGGQRSRAVRFCAVFLALFLLCVAPMLSDLYAYSRTHVAVAPESVQYASVKDTVVAQRIYLEGAISNLGVTFYAPSGLLYGDGTVTIAVTQGERTVGETVKAAKLRVLSGYNADPVTMLEENSRYEMTYRLRSGLSGFSEGEAVVSAYSDDLPAGTDLFCEVSATLTSGLPSATAGENILGYPMVLEYDVLHLDGHFWYETALLALLVALLGLAAWLLSREFGDGGRGAWLYWICAAIIFVTVSIRNPYAAFYGEPRSEAVYEFWYKAERLGFFGSLFSPMSGEAPAVWERLLMWLANALVPRRYVFVAAQLMELAWISLVASMPCLPAFRRYFRDEARLMIGVFIGTALLFNDAYYFWSCSYWALLFFLFFALLPLEELPIWGYAAGLLLTAALCMSRIYHILLVPAAVIAALVLGRQRGRRFTVYCGTVAVFSAMEGIVAFSAKDSLSAGASPIVNLMDIGLLRAVGNTLYYQLQTINSFLTGSAHWQGSGSNVLCGLVFLALLGFWIHSVKTKRAGLGVWLGVLGFLSLGTIAINVYVSGSAAPVLFPTNYASPVDWGRNYYQRADLHFSYAYICLLLLLLTALYAWDARRRTAAEGVGGGDGRAAARGHGAAIAACVALLLIVSTAVNMKPRPGYGDAEIVVEWDSVWQVTEGETYFAAVNTFYGAAPISLEQGTDEMIFGLDGDGALYQWREGLDRYALDRPYRSAEIGAVSDAQTRPVLSVTAKRALTNFDVGYVAVLYDRAGNELARAPQAQRERRLWLDFLFDKPVTGVYRVDFQLADGNPAFIENGLQIGYVVEQGRNGHEDA